MTKVSREHVLDILAHAQVTPEQERTILALDYPADLDHVLALFARYGVTRDWLMNRFGASP